MIATAQMAPQDRGFSGRGHAVLGGAAAHLGRQRHRPGHPDLRRLHRHGDRQFEGEQARLRGARNTAGGDRRCARALLRAEDLRPGFARHRHADLLPAAAGRPGRVVRARQGRPVLDRQGVRESALRPVRHAEHALLAGERDRRVALRERPQRADSVGAVHPDRRHRVRDARDRSGAAAQPSRTPSSPCSATAPRPSGRRRAIRRPTCSSSTNRSAGSRPARRSSSAAFRSARSRTFARNSTRRPSSSPCR